MSLISILGSWTRRRRLGSLSGVTLLLLVLYFGSHLANGASSKSGLQGGSNRSSQQHSGIDRECNGIGNLIKSKGFSYPWWNPNSGIGTRLPSGIPNPTSGSMNNASVGILCPAGKTGDKSTNCCKELSAPTQRNEMISAFSEKWLGPKLAANADVFKERKKKFDVTFKDLLTRAHADFHAMFERT
jgi:hypothetical protein